MPAKFQLITELYDQTVQNVTRSYESWTGFLRAACYNYKCPFDEQILIYAQRPDATAVLEMERWNRRFGHPCVPLCPPAAYLDDAASF